MLGGSTFMFVNLSGIWIWRDSGTGVLSDCAGTVGVWLQSSVIDMPSSAITSMFRVRKVRNVHLSGQPAFAARDGKPRQDTDRLA